MTETLRFDARRFLGRAWQLAYPYWNRSNERPLAWTLLLTVLGISLGLVYIAVLLNRWNRDFFNAVQARDYAAFMHLLLYFCVLAAIYIVAAVLRAYLRQMLYIRWRIWLTREYLHAWLGDKVYYRLEQDARGTDNPDQRISEDLRVFTNTTLTLTLDLLQQVVTVISFLAILWTVSGPLEFTFQGGVWVIPGYMVWAAFIYAVLGTTLTYYVGRPLVRLNFMQERYEADLRFSLVRVREYSEGIALYGGESAESSQLDRRVANILANWWGIMKAQMRLNFFTNGYAQLATVFPFFVAAPRYFSGAIQFGNLTQIADAFGTVQTSLSWFVQNYPDLASWKATVDRLLTFEQAITAARFDARERRGVVSETASTRSLRGEHVRLALPNGTTILKDGSFAIEPGEKLLLTGPSGSGKSTLFRAIAGLWTYGDGRVEIPQGAKVMFLPQKPYIPIAEMRDALAYPAPGHAYSDDALREALRSVGLPQFADKLDEIANWSLALSGGEQQKLAIARALLAKPDWLFLDEATASLDEESERALYHLLSARLPHAAIVSIAHRSQVAKYHANHLAIADQTLRAVA
jgi:vitamin B12/bleomycin/antimicrobial peptide transport system ATP-binding/permease protein